MRRTIAILVVCVACRMDRDPPSPPPAPAPAPRDDMPAGVWQHVDHAPASEPELPRGEEPRDCEGHRDVFALTGGRALVVAEPCRPGATSVILRDAGGEHRLASDFEGAGGPWRAHVLPGNRVLLVDGALGPQLFVADLDGARVSLLPRPGDLPPVSQLDVGVVRDRIYLSGGVVIRSGGCEHATGHPCDRWTQRTAVPGAWVLRLADRAATP